MIREYTKKDNERIKSLKDDILISAKAHGLHDYEIELEEDRINLLSVLLFEKIYRHNNNYSDKIDSLKKEIFYGYNNDYNMNSLNAASKTIDDVSNITLLSFFMNPFVTVFFVVLIVIALVKVPQILVAIGFWGGLIFLFDFIRTKGGKDRHV
jgi:hypothetical protein